MSESTIQLNVRKAGEGRTKVIDIKGDVTGAAGDDLTEAYNTATADNQTKAIVLNYTDLQYMNSTGIGLLVTLLVRAKRQRQKMLAFGLSDHYRQIFELTRLDEAVTILNSEQEAVAAAAS